ncbi:MAG: adenosine nucleotide hydrolase [Thermoleophilia bacterium]
MSAAGLARRPVVVSWSGGKDATLALHRATRAGAVPRALVTMLVEGGERSRSHGLRRAVLEAQAAALDLPLVARATSWGGYEAAFVDALGECASLGIADAVYGDLDVDEHRAWVERVSARAGLRAHLPLWRADRAAVVAEVERVGIDARVVAVRDGVLPRDLLGRRVDAALAAEVVALGADACGEAGEYHTVVADAPGFARPVPLVPGEAVLRDGVWFLDVEPG